MGPGTFVGLSHSHLGVKTQIFGPFSAAYPRSIAASYIISGTGSVHIVCRDHSNVLYTICHNTGPSVYEFNWYMCSYALGACICSS